MGKLGKMILDPLHGIGPVKFLIVVKKIVPPLICLQKLPYNALGPERIVFTAQIDEIIPFPACIQQVFHRIEFRLDHTEAAGNDIHAFQKIGIGKLKEVELDVFRKFGPGFPVDVDQVKLIAGIDLLKHGFKNIGFVMDHDEISNPDLLGRKRFCRLKPGVRSGSIRWHTIEF